MFVLRALGYGRCSDGQHCLAHSIHAYDRKIVGKPIECQLGVVTEAMSSVFPQISVSPSHGKELVPLRSKYLASSAVRLDGLEIVDDVTCDPRPIHCRLL